MPIQLKSALDSLEMFFSQILQFLPQLVIGVVLLLVGWILARLFRLLLIRVLKLMRVDVAAEKAGIEDFLLRGGVQYTTVNVIANVVYWFLMLALTLAVLNSLGLAVAAELFNKVLLYIPNIIGAVLVLVFGTLFAKLVRGAAFTYLSNVGISGAEFLTNVAHWAMIFLIIFIALQQLSLGGQILVSAFEMAFGGLCLALAIAFGLAGKEWAMQILEKLWRNSR